MIQAKPTSHGGYVFRSQLEARWALFFDKIHAPYIYELDGYTLKGGAISYRPDFWLPECKTYVEIKPYTPSADEMDKAFYLALESGFNTVIVCGDPYGLLETHWYLTPPNDAEERQATEEVLRDLGLLDEPLVPEDVVYKFSKEIAYLWKPNASKMARNAGNPFDLILYPYLNYFDELNVKTDPHALLPYLGVVYLTVDAHALEARMHPFWKPKGSR